MPPPKSAEYLKIYLEQKTFNFPLFINRFLMREKYLTACLYFKKKKVIYKKIKKCFWTNF